MTFEDDAHSGDEDIPSSLLVHEESDSDDKEEAISDKSVCAVSIATKQAVCVLRHALIERRLIAHLRGPLGGFLSKADAKVTRMRFLHFMERCVFYAVGLSFLRGLMLGCSFLRLRLNLRKVLCYSSNFFIS